MSSNSIPLPEACQPIAARFTEVEKAKFKVAADLRINVEKAREADLALAEAQNGDPADPTSSQRLTDCMMRAQLYKNHQATLEKRQAQVIDDGNQVVRLFARELRKIGVEHQSKARQKLVANITAETGAYPNQIESVLAMGQIRAKGEAAADVLQIEAHQYEMDTRTSRTPTENWQRLVDLWEDFSDADNE